MFIEMICSSKRFHRHRLEYGLTSLSSYNAGRKSPQASTKIWEHGQLDLHNQNIAIDHGMATAMTRMGILGEYDAGSAKKLNMF